MYLIDPNPNLCNFTKQLMTRMADSFPKTVTNVMQFHRISLLHRISHLIQCVHPSLKSQQPSIPLGRVGKYASFCLRVVATNKNFSAATCEQSLFRTDMRQNLISTLFKLNQPPPHCLPSQCFKKGVKHLYCTTSCNKIRCDK